MWLGAICSFLRKRLIIPEYNVSKLLVTPHNVPLVVQPKQHAALTKLQHAHDRRYRTAPRLMPAIYSSSHVHNPKVLRKCRYAIKHDSINGLDSTLAASKQMQLDGFRALTRESSGAALLRARDNEAREAGHLLFADSPGLLHPQHPWQPHLSIHVTFLYCSRSPFLRRRRQQRRLTGQSSPKQILGLTAALSLGLHQR